MTGLRVVEVNIAVDDVYLPTDGEPGRRAFAGVMTLLTENGTPGLAVIDGVDVDAVAAAVPGCAGVAALDGGPFGEVVSYLPGRRVTGVVVGDGRVTGAGPVPVGNSGRRTWPRASSWCWRR